MNIPQAQLKAGISRVAVKACSAQRLRDVPQHGGEGVRRSSQGGGQHEGHLETAQRHDIGRLELGCWKMLGGGIWWNMVELCLTCPEVLVPINVHIQCMIHALK